MDVLWCTINLNYKVPLYLRI